MKRGVKRQLAAMIIAMGLQLPLVAPVFSADGSFSPDPVAFAINMELGDQDKAREWLDKGMDPDFTGSRIGSGLMIAAWQGNIELMRLFLARGANIDKLNAHGESALALAAWRGQAQAVRWLLERGAKVNAPDHQWSALHYAVFAGQEALTDELLARGADVNALTSNGSSALMMAAREGHEQLARKLLEKGADRSVRNDWGDGVLEWAMRHNRLTIARMVTNPEEFNIAVSQPKTTWGEPVKSVRMSRELEDMLKLRERLVERKFGTEAIDRRIAAERARIVRDELGRDQPPRVAALEISANRQEPNKQATRLVYRSADQKAAEKKRK